MSDCKELVRFRVPICRFTSSSRKNIDALKGVIVRAMGNSFISPGKLDNFIATAQRGNLDEIIFECTPLQFARFIVYRNDNHNEPCGGLQNMITELEPEIIERRDIYRVIEAWKRA